ncbi:serpentine type 7TM GPCR chemoreceptor srt domain-containing protein [Ditylenchus destructor]|nr:serpentine type 7TM GPCR chemoreceptor srt domain-containing protein [Ditylenchus destructor]
MSLSDFVFNHGQFMDKYFYACSRYNVDVIPIEERRHVTVGILCITYGVLCEMLYLPCLWAIYQQIKRNRSATCYIFMFYLGIVDTAGIVVTAFIAGIQSIQGVVYCQSPVVNYVFVFVELFGWFAANTTTLILAINRCMVIYDDDVANKFFKGRRGTMWLIVPTIVGILGICLSRPLFFDPIDTGAVYNPHKHYLPDDDFCPSAALITYNWFIVIAVPGIYFLFAAFLVIRFRDGGITPSSEFSEVQHLSTFA